MRTAASERTGSRLADAGWPRSFAALPKNDLRNLRPQGGRWPAEETSRGAGERRDRPQNPEVAHGSGPRSNSVWQAHRRHRAVVYHSEPRVRFRLVRIQLKRLAVL